MCPSRVPINSLPLFIQEITSKLAALNALRLPDGSVQQVRLLQLRRLARRIEASIPEHFEHGERTASYALLLAKAIGLAEEQRTNLHYAALLHDIGLLTLPGGLLNEAAPLTLDEYVLVQSHPRAGAALLSPYDFLSESACVIAHHHERWDGAGYPYGLHGTYIPVSARILSIADVFDAISVRSESFHVALRTLRASLGTQFDPDLLETFCVLLEDHNNRRPFLLRSPMATTIVSTRATAAPSRLPVGSANLTLGPR